MNSSGLASFDIKSADVCRSDALVNIVAIFNRLYEQALNTRLVGGADEPLYQPKAEAGGTNTIYFTRDYVASALHEIAHWCLAGAERRKQLDYGYWYAPDGRSQAQQRKFEQFEIKPQAIEWILSSCCALPFRLSSDNLNAEARPSQSFAQAVSQQAQQYCIEGLPERAQVLANAFSAHFSTDNAMHVNNYQDLPLS